MSKRPVTKPKTMKNSQTSSVKPQPPKLTRPPKKNK